MRNIRLSTNLTNQRNLKPRYCKETGKIVGTVKLLERKCPESWQNPGKGVILTSSTAICSFPPFFHSKAE